MSAELQSPALQVRRLRMNDVTAVYRIEQRAYEFPWSKGIFSDCLRVGYACWGLEVADKLAGYAILSSAAGEAHLLNLCIDPALQNRGYGQVLLNHAVAHAEALQCRVIFLEVRPSNLIAQRLYQQHGFRIIGRRPGYYQADGGREDAVVMSRHLPAAEMLKP